MFKNLNWEQICSKQSNADVAQKMGISQNEYELKKENGDFSVSQVVFLMQLFNCDFEYLFACKESKKLPGRHCLSSKEDCCKTRINMIK